MQALGGCCDLVEDAGTVHARAAEHARWGACHLDQFGLAERATDWRGNNNIAESIIGQLALEPRKVPTWIVCGAGTGSTSATIGRYLRYRGLDTRLCVAEPTGAAFANGWQTRNRSVLASQPTLIEGIGRSCVEPGFIFEVVDAVEQVDDADSIAAAWLLEDLLGCRYGGSVWHQLRRMPAAGRRHARARRNRQHRDPAVRPWRALPAKPCSTLPGWRRGV